MAHRYSAALIFLVLAGLACVGYAQQPSATNIAGGRGGNQFADTRASSDARILEIQVCAGDRVDSVQVVYQLPDGRAVSGQRHGGSGGSTHVFRLDSDEYVTAISGRYGDTVDSMTIQTNKRSSPRFGGSGGSKDYRLEIPYGNQAVGFLGRSGQYLDAVGLLYAPLPAAQASQGVIFGGRGGSAFSDDNIPAGARISEIRVRAGDRIDSIQAIYTLANGQTMEGSRHGGGGGKLNTFRLDSDEYVIGIYGRYGDNVDSIAIRTNKRTSPVFGGRGGNKDFQINAPDGSMAIGFLGRSGQHLDAIGLTYVSINTPGSNWIRRLPGRRRN